ncbi:hypothetical protein BHM03_00019936 [Ensete ventricosum]|nr:hypothetical protein BHM03_00019936 [Ensete ventricosum]
MVAWLFEMSTPEFPGGRKIVVVANDVTFKVGSFGPKEDAFFHAVTNLACDKKLPIIDLAANSGARIEAGQEVKSCFRVGWSDELNPERGFQYIYLSPEDYKCIGSSVVSHELKLENGEIRWVIDIIVGKADDLGVEKLSGRRTVGIGAYLARLGMRCTQRLDQPIILTGFSTLNKLLGREGFDRDSFIVTLEGWGKTVVTGRTKLGGIPVGVIAVETQTVRQVIPADPGQLDSHEREVPQAGQVWFLDSATKTAQSLLDFNREELPLFILANWRGSSGGQRDIFEGILQAGSKIVENLRTYKQPVFVYIPMTGELRGGAWVIVDGKINPEHIEMHAERTAKGNVLEPEGMIEIKFRTKDLIECMGRLDHEIVGLKAKLQDVRDGIVPGDAEALRRSIMILEKNLLPNYTRIIATHFAELHDTSLRMAAKGVIKKVVDWEGSCSFF